MTVYDLTDKVFFVTGAAQCIGKGIIEGLLSKQAKVYFVDIQEDVGRATQAELENKFGSDRVCFSVCNITDRQQFEECFQKAVSKFGIIDVVFNNAGLVGENRAKHVVDVNLTGTIYGTEIAMKYMRKDKGGKGGRIINMSSIAGLGNYLWTPVYTATKQGVRAYTQSLSLNPFIEETGIEFATLHPDGVDTGMAVNYGPDDLLHMDRIQYNYTPVPLSKVVEAFITLVSLEKMNGAALRVTHDSMDYMKTESFEIGKTYPPKE